MSEEGYSVVDAIPVDVVDKAEGTCGLFVDASDAMKELGLLGENEYRTRFDDSGDAAMEKLFGSDNLDNIEVCITLIAMAVAVKRRKLRSEADAATRPENVPESRD